MEMHVHLQGREEINDMPDPRPTVSMSKFYVAGLKQLMIFIAKCILGCHFTFQFIHFHLLNNLHSPTL